LLRREQVIGIVSSWDVRRASDGFSILFFAGGEDEGGYSLLITNERVVGAHRSDYPKDFWAYLGPDSTVGDDIKAKASDVAAEMVAKEDFELQKDHIVKIIYREPTTYIGGRLLFVTVGRHIRLKITIVSPFNSGIISTLQTLSRSLFAFAPDKLYDEKTGQRLGALQNLKYH
jgi:hypothetical protein